MGNPIPSSDALIETIAEGLWAQARQKLLIPGHYLPRQRKDFRDEAAARLRALSNQPDSTDDGLAELLRECRKDFDRCADIVDRHLYRQSEKVEDVRLIALSAVTRIDTALSTGRQS